MIDENHIIILSSVLKERIHPIYIKKFKVIPKEETNGEFHLFIDQKFNREGINKQLETILNKKIVLFPQSSEIINRAISTYYAANDTQDTINYDGGDFDLVIQQAKVKGASDIHIEKYEQSCRVRIRIDGDLIEEFVLSEERYAKLISQIKIRADLNITEKRLPQDGRIAYRENNFKFDLRVSTLPTIFGEKVVLRILNSEQNNIGIEKIGFTETEKEKYLEAIEKENGIILISGPTGSGKTTTLYSTLKYLNKTDRNIITIEDPIEYILDGINQVQLSEKIGLDYDKVLKGFLRQDPNILMLGEIRDKQTAQSAIRQSLTGHLVFSTIHTNSALETITRLVDLEIPSYLIANTLELSIAQRLVPVLCSHCKKEDPIDIEKIPFHLRNMVQNVKNVFKPNGCDVCNFTGYKGRKPIFEMLYIDSEVQNSIRNGNYIEYFNRTKTYKTIEELAFEEFLKGNTSLEKVITFIK